MDSHEPSQAQLDAVRAELAETSNRLARAEAMLAVIERTGRVGVWEADLATGEGWWSPAMYEFYRLDPADGPPSFTAYLDNVHPDDHARVMASM